MKAKSYKAALAGLMGLVFYLQTPAAAKVVFTGYGDLQLSAAKAKLYGDAPALASFGLSDTDIESRGFAINSIGLFATTNLKENMDFMVDFSYRQIGNTTKETRIQYAYLEHTPSEDFKYRLGRFPLPFGYFNQNRFYSFQRKTGSGPLFLTSILGLPIADTGAGVQKQFKTSLARIDLDLYGVNGYGGNPIAPTKFRTATPLGGITVSNNLSYTNNNKDIAFGGRLTFAEIGGRNMETGFSYYNGAWDPSGKKYLQMMDGHFHTGLARFDLLAEYVHVDVQGDTGFAAAVGDSRWRTDGWFMMLSYPLWNIDGKPLTPFAGAERFVSRGYHGGGGREKAQYYRAGLCYEPMETMKTNLEYGALNYTLPLAGLGDLKLDIPYFVTLSMSLTF